MNIQLVPALFDNYIFLLYDVQQKIAGVVDPAEAEPIIKCLKKLKVELVSIFNTHHHFDHVGANQELLQYFPNLSIYGGSEDKGRIPGQKFFLQEGDRLEFAGRVAEIFFVPGHTRGHIAYYFHPQGTSEPGDLFCGDTLFAGGCGRLFEGTPAQMVQSLSKLRELPDSTRIWCAHEYTLKNLEFALTVEPDNQALQQRYQQVKQQRSQDIPTIPSTIAIEKQTNPFLRWDTPSLQKIAGSQQPATVFGRIRQMKD
jgi:hydroxyacylglutathione hydrolase